VQRGTVGQVDERGLAQVGGDVGVFGLAPVQDPQRPHREVEVGEVGLGPLHRVLGMLERGGGRQDHHLLGAVRREQLGVEAPTIGKPLAPTDQRQRPRHPLRSHRGNPTRSPGRRRGADGHRLRDMVGWAIEAAERIRPDIG